MSQVMTVESSEQTTKYKIFMAAAQLFSKRGYNGVSIREICEETGLSKPTIYYYFGSKEGIYKALVDTGISLGENQSRAILEKHIPIKQKLIELLQSAFQNTIDYPEFVKFFQNLFTLDDKLTFLDDVIRMANERRQRVAELIHEGMEKGEFGSSADPQLVSDVFIGTATHFIWKQLTSDEKILSDQLAEDIIEFLFKGLNE
jgi:TetR/AcrR family transcriptional regulator